MPGSERDILDYCHRRRLGYGQPMRADVPVLLFWYRRGGACADSTLDRGGALRSGHGEPHLHRHGRLGRAIEAMDTGAVDVNWGAPQPLA